MSTQLTNALSMQKSLVIAGLDRQAVDVNRIVKRFKPVVNGNTRTIALTVIAPSLAPADNIAGLTFTETVEGTIERFIETSERTVSDTVKGRVKDWDSNMRNFIRTTDNVALATLACANLMHADKLIGLKDIQAMTQRGKVNLLDSEIDVLPCDGSQAIKVKAFDVLKTGLHPVALNWDMLGKAKYVIA